MSQSTASAPQKCIQSEIYNCKAGWSPVDQVPSWYLPVCPGIRSFLRVQTLAPGTASAPRAGQCCNTVWTPAFYKVHLCFPELSLTGNKQFFRWTDFAGFSGISVKAHSWLLPLMCIGERLWGVFPYVHHILIEKNAAHRFHFAFNDFAVIWNKPASVSFIKSNTSLEFR